MEEIGTNKDAVLFFVLGIQRVDLNFYSRRLGSLLFSADTEARFCREKRGCVASGESLSVDRGDVRTPANVHPANCGIVFKWRFAGDCRETVRIELRIALDRFDVLTVDIEARTDFGVGVETFFDTVRRNHWRNPPMWSSSLSSALAHLCSVHRENRQRRSAHAP